MKHTQNTVNERITVANSYNFYCTQSKKGWQFAQEVAMSQFVVSPPLAKINCMLSDNTSTHYFILKVPPSLFSSCVRPVYTYNPSYTKYTSDTFFIQQGESYYMSTGCIQNGYSSAFFNIFKTKQDANTTDNLFKW